MANVEGQVEAAAESRDGDSPSDASAKAPAIPVNQAFNLGWNMSILYQSGEAPSWRERRGAPDRLPSPSRFSKSERSLIRLGQVTCVIGSFSNEFGAAGWATSQLEAAGDHIDRLTDSGGNGGGDGEPRQSLCAAHLAIAQGLSANDAGLAKAYHLGVALAATCHAPKQLAALQGEFNRHRIARLGEWLADLTAHLPRHSSRAVRLSMAAWRRWVENPQMKLSALDDVAATGRHRLERLKAFADRRTRPLDWKSEGTEVRRSLARQGEVWRAMLAGEKPGTEMLEAQDYLATGARALRNGVRLLRGLWLPLGLAIAMLAVGSWLLLRDGDASSTAAGVVTVAGAVGITWKGILGGLGTVVSKIQRPVWGAALDESIATAITTLPPGAKEVPQRAARAAPASGPQPAVLALPEEVTAKPEWAP